MAKKLTLRDYNTPMAEMPRTPASAYKPPGSPVRHRTPRSQALAMGTDREGFVDLAAEYHVQGGAPTSETGGRDFAAEQRIRDAQAETPRVPPPVPSGFRMKR